MNITETSFFKNKRKMEPSRLLLFYFIPSHCGAEREARLDVVLESAYINQRYGGHSNLKFVMLRIVKVVYLILCRNVSLRS
jgi:hypothetical protein